MKMVKGWKNSYIPVIVIFALVLAALLAPSGMARHGIASAQDMDEQLLYGADGAGGNPANLYILNPRTGAVMRTIGPIGYGITGLAFEPRRGILYGSTGRQDPIAPCSLIRIDTRTGRGTLIGPLNCLWDGHKPHSAADISFHPRTGVLYGWMEPQFDDLATINLQTGQATIVGDSRLGTYGSGLAFSPKGTLYFTGDGDDDWLRTINPKTGKYTNVVIMSGTEGNEIGALAFGGDRNALYGVRSFGEGASKPGDLIIINTSTGQITSLGQTVPGFSAIAFSP